MKILNIIFLYLFVFQSVAFSQTVIHLSLKNTNREITKVDIFDLSQTSIHDLEYKEQLEVRFKQKNIDCYNIRYHEGNKMYRQQIWLDTGDIYIKAHISGDELVIDTVLNSPTYYEYQKKSKIYSTIFSKEGAEKVSDFLWVEIEKNATNPLSIFWGMNFFIINQNNVTKLLKLKDFLIKQPEELSYFILKESLLKQLESKTSIKAIHLEDFTFINRAQNKIQIELKGADYYVFDLWFLGCKPCREQHEEIKKDFAKFTQKNVKIISISTDMNNYEKWEEYLLSKRYTWANYLEDKDSKRITDEIGTTVYPTYIIMDKQGKVVATYNSLSEVRNKLGI